MKSHDLLCWSIQAGVFQPATCFFPAVGDKFKYYDLDIRLGGTISSIIVIVDLWSLQFIVIAAEILLYCYRSMIEDLMKVQVHIQNQNR